MDRQNQNMATNLPPNVFIHYTTPTNASTSGEKSYYKMETIPFQTNTTININQPISIINQSCLINQNNAAAAGFQTAAVINNQCVTGAPTNYVQLSGSWNHGMQQVNNEEQMIYQIMYPIIDSSNTLDGQQLGAKQTTVDANVLTAGTCAVLAPTKAITGKKHIVGGYNIVEKQNQYTNTEVVQVEVVKSAAYDNNEEDGGDSKKKAKRKKEEQDENQVYSCNICGDTFKTKGSLRFHKVHHNVKAKNKFQCIGCTEGFEKEKQKQEHELQCGRNFKMVQFECCFCDQPFDTPRGLRKHENKHRPIRKTKRYRHTCVCIECNKAFDAIYSLKMHIQKHHKSSHVKPLDDKPFSCSECGLGFKYERSKLKHEFKAHMKEEAATL